MSQRQFQSSDSTCFSSIDQQPQPLNIQRIKQKNLTNPQEEKRSHYINQEMKQKHKIRRESTSFHIRNTKRKQSKKGKRVHFKGNGSIEEMVEIVNVESYKEYNLDLANSDYKVEEKVKTNCSCQVY